MIDNVIRHVTTAILKPLCDLFPLPQVKPSTPVLMCSVPGYDASGLVRDLAAEQNKQITSISIGEQRTGVCKLQE